MRDDWRTSDQTIEPGHIWVIEQHAATPLSRLAGSAVASANVVIYDRALAPLVAEVLPTGSYAEPWSPDLRAPRPALAPRALKFAVEGWSVVQLMAAQPDWRAGLRQVTVDLPIREIDEFQEPDPPILVFGPLDLGYPRAAPAFTANGLAG